MKSNRPQYVTDYYTLMKNNRLEPQSIHEVPQLGGTRGGGPSAGFACARSEWPVYTGASSKKSWGTSV